MRRQKRRAKPGFALLEALVFVILMLLLSAAMLAAAYNLHRRSVERIENDRAYNAAVAALKMVGNAIAGGADPAAYEAETTYTLDVTPEGEAQQGYAQITMKGEVGTLTSNGESFEGVRLTAVATVAGETETVQLTLQKARAEAYPHTLYGAGFAGRISSPPTLTLGPDTDLYLYGGGAAAELLTGELHALGDALDLDGRHASLLIHNVVSLSHCGDDLDDIKFYFCAVALDNSHVFPSPLLLVCPLHNATLHLVVIFITAN